MGKCSLTRCFGCEPFGELDLVADFCHTRRRARAVHPLKHVERIERRDLFLVLRARRVLVPVTRAVKSFFFKRAVRRVCIRKTSPTTK